MLVFLIVTQKRFGEVAGAVADRNYRYLGVQAYQ